MTSGLALELWAFFETHHVLNFSGFDLQGLLSMSVEKGTVFGELFHHDLKVSIALMDSKLVPSERLWFRLIRTPEWESPIKNDVQSTLIIRTALVAS